MRGDAGLTLRLLLRSTGLAGLVTATGGGVVVAGVLRPWHSVVAEVSMLGGDSSRTVASFAAFPGTVSGWVAATLGVVVVVLGALLGLDRAPLRGRMLAAGAAAVLAGVAAAAILTVPAVGDIAADTTAELLTVGEQLPVGIGLQLRAAAGSGPWWVLAGAATALVGAASARER